MPYCPRSRMAMNLLDKAGVKYEIINFKSSPNGESLREALRGLCLYNNIPNIFIGGVRLGHYEDLKRA